MFVKLLVIAAALAGLGGCASPVAKPESRLVAPTSWIGAMPAGNSKEVHADAWWRDFHDPRLDSLVEVALAANSDVHIAAARVAQARAMVGFADAERLPEVGLGAGISRGRQSSAAPKATAAYAGFRASWEADLFGGKGLVAEAARHDAAAAELAMQATRTALVADVANAWFDLRSLVRREALAGNTVSVLEKQVQVAERRFGAGQVSRLDVDRLIAELGQEKANIAQLRGQREIRQRQLAVLLGDANMGRDVALDESEIVPVTALPSLLPAELLDRRPDVQLQARMLDAEVARLGVARRDLYPRIFFDWSGRKERLGVSGGEAATTIVVGYGLSLSLPIFDGGRIRSNIAVHEAKTQEAMAAYEKAVLLALADAEIALSQFAAAKASQEELGQASRSAADAASRSQRLFEAGLVDLNTALDARRADLRVQDGLLQAQGGQWQAAVAVRRAFAGRL